MKAPKYIIQKSYIEQQQDQEYQTHIRRLHSIKKQSVDVEKKYENVVNMMHHKHNNHKAIIEFKREQEKQLFDRENRILLENILSITMGQNVQQPMKRVPNETPTNSIIEQANSPQTSRLAQKIYQLRIQQQNSKLASKLLNLPSVYEKQKFDQYYKDHCKILSGIQKFHLRDPVDLNVSGLMENSVSSTRSSRHNYNNNITVIRQASSQNQENEKIAILPQDGPFEEIKRPLSTRRGIIGNVGTPKSQESGRKNFSVPRNANTLELRPVISAQSSKSARGLMRKRQYYEIEMKLQGINFAKWSHHQQQGDDTAYFMQIFNGPVSLQQTLSMEYESFCQQSISLSLHKDPRQYPLLIFELWQNKCNHDTHLANFQIDIKTLYESKDDIEIECESELYRLKSDMKFLQGGLVRFSIIFKNLDPPPAPPQVNSTQIEASIPEQLESINNLTTQENFNLLNTQEDVNNDGKND